MMQVSGHNAQVTPLPGQPPATDYATWVSNRRLTALHRAGYTGQGVKVLVIDTGVDVQHPFLAPAIRGVRNFTLNDNADGTNATDRHGHGTHVAGLIRMGAPGADLYVAKGLSDSGQGPDAWLAAAIRWGIAQGIHIINASWGDSEEPTDGVLHKAICEAIEANILFVSAAGNNGHEQLHLNTVGWPARWPEPFVVASTNTMSLNDMYGNHPAPFSSAGPEVDTAAPGTFAFSCAPGGGWAYLSGTSMAAPMQVALAACLRSMWVSQTGRAPTEPEMVTLCYFHTRDIKPVGRDALSGVGEIDAAPLVERRQVVVTDGSPSIAIETSKCGEITQSVSTVSLDVPAKIEQNRFLVPFRGLLNAVGARLIDWKPGDPSRPGSGVAIIDVLDSGSGIDLD